jgi:hypothetical protein
MTARLLDGPALAAGPESLTDHRARLGTLPGRAGQDIVPQLAEAGRLAAIERATISASRPRAAGGMGG